MESDSEDISVLLLNYERRSLLHALTEDDDSCKGFCGRDECDTDRTGWCISDALFTPFEDPRPTVSDVIASAANGHLQFPKPDYCGHPPLDVSHFVTAMTNASDASHAIDGTSTGQILIPDSTNLSDALYEERSFPSGLSEKIHLVKSVSNEPATTATFPPCSSVPPISVDFACSDGMDSAYIAPEGLSDIAVPEYLNDCYNAQEELWSVTMMNPVSIPSNHSVKTAGTKLYKKRGVTKGTTPYSKKRGAKERKQREIASHDISLNLDGSKVNQTEEHQSASASTKAESDCSDSCSVPSMEHWKDDHDIFAAEAADRSGEGGVSRLDETINEASFDPDSLGRDYQPPKGAAAASDGAVLDGSGTSSCTPAESMKLGIETSSNRLESSKWARSKKQLSTENDGVIQPRVAPRSGRKSSKRGLSGNAVSVDTPAVGATDSTVGRKRRASSKSHDELFMTQGLHAEDGCQNAEGLQAIYQTKVTDPIGMVDSNDAKHHTRKAPTLFISMWSANCGELKIPSPSPKASKLRPRKKNGRKKEH